MSSHQGSIDWSRVAGDGISFANIKASEGGDLVDRSFAENWATAATTGLDRGAYHFFTLCTAGSVQALNFLATAPPAPSALAPALDLELAGNCSARPDQADVEARLNAFLRIVEQAWGKQTVLYIGDDFEGRYHLRQKLGRPLWHARFLRRPDVKGWMIWQVDDLAHVAGIADRVDLDVMRLPPS